MLPSGEAHDVEGLELHVAAVAGEVAVTASTVLVADGVELVGAEVFAMAFGAARLGERIRLMAGPVVAGLAILVADLLECHGVAEFAVVLKDSVGAGDGAVGERLVPAADA